MNAFILVCLLFLSSRASGLCLPDTLASGESNNEDMLLLENLAEEVHGNLLPHFGQDQELVIVFQALNPRVNAEIKKNNNQFVLELFGGMLSHPKMNENTFRLLLCHELGHALGGTPLKSRTGWSATEGQADYFSGKFCAKLLGIDETSFTEGALNLTTIYAEVMREAPPKLYQSDERQVERTNYGYPSVQCRLQTILAGWKDGPRPRCWFKE